MCYLHRQQQDPVHAVDPVATPGQPTVRPRWAGAALLLIGGLAVAAALVEAPPPTGTTVQEVAAPVPTSTTAAAMPVGAGSTQVSLPADDGVPSAIGIVKAGVGACHHGM